MRIILIDSRAVSLHRDRRGVNRRNRRMLVGVIAFLAACSGDRDSISRLSGPPANRDVARSAQRVSFDIELDAAQSEVPSAPVRIHVERERAAGGKWTSVATFVGDPRLPWPSLGQARVADDGTVRWFDATGRERASRVRPVSRRAGLPDSLRAKLGEMDARAERLSKFRRATGPLLNGGWLDDIVRPNSERVARGKKLGARIGSRGHLVVAASGAFDSLTVATNTGEIVRTARTYNVDAHGTSILRRISLAAEGLSGGRRRSATITISNVHIDGEAK